MEIAELFELPNRFDPAAPGAEAERLAARFRDANEDDEPARAKLGEIGSIAWDAAALVTFATEGLAVSPAALNGVHDLAVLAFAVDRARHQLIDPGESASSALAADLHALGPVARGESAGAGRYSNYLYGVRQRLSTLPGWSVGESTVVSRLVDLLDGFAQQYRLRAAAIDDFLGAGLEALTRGAWLDVVIEAACIAAGDGTRARRPTEADVVSRLASGVIGLARDLGEHERGEGTDRSTELIAQRFAIPARVIELDAQQILRSLRATLELEVRDLIDGANYLPQDTVRGRVVKRTVAAVLELDGSASSVTTAADSPRPTRDEFMKKMRAVAREDGQITSDERALLRGMDTHLHAFAELVARIEEDRRVDFEEFEQLRTTRQGILDDMFRIALSDKEITADERQLLLRAMELLPSLRASAKVG